MVDGLCVISNEGVYQIATISSRSVVRGCTFCYSNAENSVLTAIGRPRFHTQICDLTLAASMIVASKAPGITSLIAGSACLQRALASNLRVEKENFPVSWFLVLLRSSVPGVVHMFRIVSVHSPHKTIMHAHKQNTHEHKNKHLQKQAYTKTGRFLVSRYPEIRLERFHVSIRTTYTTKHEQTQTK